MTLYFVVREVTEDEGIEWQFVGDYFDDMSDAREHAYELAQHSPGVTYEVWTAESVADFSVDPDSIEVDITETEDEDEE
jgi:hypothetical protein